MTRRILRHTRHTRRSSLGELLGQTMTVAFRNGTLDTCIVLDIDYHLRFVKLCYADDQETVFWKSLDEISSFNFIIA